MAEPMAPMGELMPAADNPGGVEKKYRASARQLAKFMWDQYEQGLAAQAPHQMLWAQVRAIMSGVHYYDTRLLKSTGTLIPLANPRNRIRAKYPYMQARYRWEHGRLSTNQIGSTVRPKLAEGAMSFYQAESGQAVLADWNRRSEVEHVQDLANQHLVQWGGSALYLYQDPKTGEPLVKATPQTEWFPIPYYASNIDEADGVMRAQLVTKAWLETEDERIKGMMKQSGQSVADYRPMAGRTKSYNLSLGTGNPAVASAGIQTASFDGALVLNIWMRPDQNFPYGLWLMMVGEELYRYRSGPNDKPQTRALLNGRLPVEFQHYSKQSDRFWGTGMCETIIPMQLELNRQLSAVISRVRHSRRVVYYDPMVLPPAQLNTSEEEDPWIPASGGRFNPEMPPWYVINGEPIGAETAAVLNLVRELADMAIGYESSVITGGAEGRVEGGPATSLLAHNAAVPLLPITQDIHRSWRITFSQALDLLRESWPEQRRVMLTGSQNMARERIIKQEDVPTSERVVVDTTPIIPNGRNAMLQMLMQMRSMARTDGGGPEVSSKEFRRSLSDMGYLPPGLDMADSDESLIAARIEGIINDGMQPGLPPAQDPRNDPQRFQNHAAMVDQLRRVILDPRTFYSYSPQVQQALMMELEFHVNFTINQVAHPDNFDDAVERADSEQSERYFRAEEADLTSFRHSARVDGVPIGAD